MKYRFEINPENKILLLRFEGRLTNELVDATRRPCFLVAPAHGWICYPPLQAFGGVRASKPAQGTRKFAPRGSRTENWPTEVNE